MARKSSFIASATSNGRTPLDQIPKDVRDEVLAALEQISKSDGRIRTEFDTEAEANDFMKLAADFAAQHKPPLKVRRSPTRNLPANVVDWRVTRDVPATAAQGGTAR